MRVAMVSCEAYRDCWPAFEALFRKYWPGQTFDIWSDGDYSRKPSWCKVVADHAERTDEPVLMLLEDFLLTGPVRVDLIERALEILKQDNVGAVRLYPCPGSNDDAGDPHFGRVSRHTAYRNSTMPTLWNPRYLHAIASRFETAWDFEIQGSLWASSHLPAEVWAFRREVQPWPIEIECTAITRGKWTQSALRMLEREGIKVDLSARK